MDAVSLIEFFNATDVFEEEGDKDGLGLVGDLGEQGFKPGGEIGSHIVRHLHAGDQDSNVGVLGSGFGDNSKQVLFGFFGGNPPKTIVPAKGDDQEVSSFSHGPGNTTETSGSGVSADPGIHDCEGKLGLVDFRLD